MNSSKQYCEQLLALHKMSGMEKAVQIVELLSSLGREFLKVDTVLSSELKKQHHCEVKECFLNAQRIGMLGEYDYYEGFATKIIPTDHAWLVDRSSGLVVDPTWEDLEEEGDYFGIKIPVRLAFKVWREEEMATQLLWRFLEEGEKDAMS